VIFAEANTRPVRATNKTVLPLAALKLALTVYFAGAASGALPALAGVATNPSKINPMVSNIIKYFRMYALPKRAQELAGRFLDYPAEFRIKFFHNGVENQFLPKIARCALKDVSLTFGDEQFTTFAPIENLGAPPSKIDMTLTFEELEIMTQDRIEQGY
jgi:hypothetical protein